MKEADYTLAVAEGRLFDVPDYSGTIRYTQVVSVLRHCREVLGQTLHAWDAFVSLEPQCFLCESNTLNKRWAGHIDNLNLAVEDLRAFSRTLEYKIQTFDRMKNDVSVVHVNGCRSHAVSARQCFWPKEKSGRNKARKKHFRPDVYNCGEQASHTKPCS